MGKSKYKSRVIIGQKLNGKPIYKYFYSSISKMDARRKGYKYAIGNYEKPYKNPYPDTKKKEYSKLDIFMGRFVVGIIVIFIVLMIFMGSTYRYL